MVPETYPSVLVWDVLGLLNTTVKCAMSSVSTLTQSSSSNIDTFIDTTVGLYPNYQHHISLTADTRTRVNKLRPVAPAKHDAVLAEVQHKEKEKT